MLLGCCHCDAPFFPRTSSSGDASSVQSTGASSFTGSTDDWPECGQCIAGVMPMRFRVTWPYAGTAGGPFAPQPCCGYYNRGPVDVVFAGSTSFGGLQQCYYESLDRALEGNTNTNGCATYPSLPLCRLSVGGNPINPGSPVYGTIQFFYRLIRGFGFYTVMLEYAGIIGTVPHNCVQQFTVPILTSLPGWHTGGTVSPIVTPCNFYASTYDANVTATPA